MHALMHVCMSSCTVCYCTPFLTIHKICTNVVICIVPNCMKICLVVFEFPHRTSDCADRWIDVVGSTVLHLLFVHEPKSSKDVMEHAVVL
jgi:hypothetical protein